MNDNLERKGRKYLQDLFGDGLSFEEFEKNLEDQNNEFMLLFFKNLYKFFGLSEELGEYINQNISLEMPPKEYFQTLEQTFNQVFKSNPDLVKKFEELGKNFEIS